MSLLTLINTKKSRSAAHRPRLESLEDRRLMAGDLAFSSADAFAVGDTPWDVAAGDLNGDGILDLAVANFGQRPPAGDISVLIGRGDGSFDREVRYDADNKPNSIVIADLNQDGHADIAVTNVDSHNISVLLNNGDGTFPEDPPSYPVGTFPTSIRVADANEDGHLDFIFSTDNSGIQLLPGNGDGTFSPAGAIHANAVRGQLNIGDFNGDDHVDIAHSDRDRDQVSILLGRGDGAFDEGSTLASGRRPNGFAVGDLNSDGYLDLMVANNHSDDVSVMLGQGDGSFADGVTFSVRLEPSSIALADWDLDGDLDAAVLNNPVNGGAGVSVLLNDGTGQFSESTELELANTKWSVSIIAADLDSDGKLDMVATNDECCGGGIVSALLNQTQALPGDANLDGQVEAADLNSVGLNWRGTGKTWTQGDFTGDGLVDAADLNVLALNWQSGVEPQASAALGGTDRADEDHGLERPPRAPLSTANRPIIARVQVETSSPTTSTEARADGARVDSHDEPLTPVSVSPLAAAEPTKTARRSAICGYSCHAARETDHVFQELGMAHEDGLLR